MHFKYLFQQMHLFENKCGRQPKKNSKYTKNLTPAHNETLSQGRLTPTRVNRKYSQAGKTHNLL